MQMCRVVPITKRGKGKTSDIFYWTQTFFTSYGWHI